MNRSAGAGYSIRAAAQETGLPAKRIQRAIELGQVRVVELGTVKRIPESEVERLRGLYDAETPSHDATAALQMVADRLTEITDEIRVLLGQLK